MKGDQDDIERDPLARERLKVNLIWLDAMGRGFPVIVPRRESRCDQQAQLICLVSALIAIGVVLITAWLII